MASILLLAGTVARAAVPPEVPTNATFGADRQTLTWNASAGATSYDVYRGTSPSAYDHACRVYRTAPTFALLSETPSPGVLFYYYIAGANGEGEGILGRDGAGNAVPNGQPCLDSDGDLVANNLDNCPSAANPSQADQDVNAVGDKCDPNTYDFEADSVGARPAAMTSYGPSAQSLTVKLAGGEHVVTYDQPSVGTSDGFDRLTTGMPRQDVTVYIDWDSVASYASIELWSDGCWGWNAGNGIILQLADNATMRFYDRHAQSVPLQQGPMLPPGGRMRLRLIKGPGATSTLHVDSWDGASWTPDWASFPVADDHRYLGRGTVIADYFGGSRPVKRITVVPTIPAGALRVRKDPAWSTDWKVFQRDALGRAAVPVQVFYRQDAPGTLQARVVRTSNGSPLPGFDWTDHALALPVSPGATASLDLAAVPTGGNYDVEVRLVRTGDGAVLGQENIVQIAVGDVYLAGGQSNMSGYSGTLAGAEPPIDEVHLFHNDGIWKRALEPMDDGTDQTDRVSYETPAHSLMLRLGKEIFQATGIPVGIIPGPMGGTNLNTQWQRNDSRHDDRGTLYGSLLHRALLQSFVTPPKGFLWYQGESDVGIATNDYVAYLQELVAKYREDLGAPGLRFGIVQLATYADADLATWIPIQEAQRQVVEAEPLAVLAVPIDLPRADSIHLSVAGYKTLGVRLAREFLQHAYGQAIDASARLTKATITGVNGRTIDLTYDAPVTGGAAALYQVRDGANTINVSSVSASGNIVSLSLPSTAHPDSVVTYGFSKLPTAAWVKDAQGTPVAIFEDYATTP
jgi:hypothetical protein